MLLQLLVAAAEAPPKDAGGSSGLLSMVMMIALIGAFFYFLIIRPQQKQRKEQQTMVNSLRKGDEVVTIGGIHGRIENVKDNIVLIKVAENVKIEMNKASVTQVEKRKDGDESTLQDAK